MEKRTGKNQSRTSNINTNNLDKITSGTYNKKKIDNNEYNRNVRKTGVDSRNFERNLSTNRNSNGVGNLKTPKNKSEMKLPKIPKSVEIAIRNNETRKNTIDGRSSNGNINVTRNNNVTNGLKTPRNKSEIKSPKIPKSVEIAIKSNEGRKIATNNINNVKKNLNNTMAKKNKGINRDDNNKNVKNLKKKKRSLIITFLIAIIICISILLLKLPYFNINDIELIGTNKYTKEEILEKSNIVFGENIFIQIFKCNKKNIATLPYVDKTSVTLKFPNKITIKVKERVSKYFAYDSEKEIFYKLSEDGYILEKTDINSKTQDELLIVGIPFYDYTKLGTKIDEIYMNKILIYELIQAEYDKNNFLGKVTKVNFANSLTTLTINDKLNVIFPNDTELEYKMKVLRKILNELGEDAVGKIDMTKTNPTFSSF